jgi:hypothetical protein
VEFRGIKREKILDFGPIGSVQRDARSQRNADVLLKTFRVSEEPRASARGFFQRKSQHDLKATGVQNYTANPPRSSERGILAFSRERLKSAGAVSHPLD